MLQRISIKNFRSLKNVSLNLNRINLMIGPNNSGKTNFLKAIEFIGNFIIKGADKIIQAEFTKNYYRYANYGNLTFVKEPMSFSLIFKLSNGNFGHYILDFYGFKNQEPVYREFAALTEKKLEIHNIEDLKHFWDDISSLLISVRNNAPLKITEDFFIEVLNEKNFVLKPDINGKLTALVRNWYSNELINEVNEDFYFDLQNTFKDLKIYKPDPALLSVPGKLGTDESVNSDASNLISFLDNMRDTTPEIIDKIKRDMNECIDDFVDLRFRKVEDKNEKLYKKIGFLDKRGKIFWSEEVSEGSLYFLALLSIIHQPHPPGLLLLEEPEKGIHPRRIHEIMEYIFRLAEEKKIQIILTTHNTQVVDEFEETPQSVFIFEVINGETEVKNLLSDVIEPANERSNEKGLPLIKYTELLGEKWFQGFIGGVPG